MKTGYELPFKHPRRTSAGWNLHVHALYFGPYLPFGSKGERGRYAGAVWRKVTDGEGQVLGIKECPSWRRDPRTAVRKALAHHFGYVLKPAAESGERLAALEILFSGSRKIRGIGGFNRLPKPPKKASPRCPKCGAPLPMNLRAWHRSARVTIALLEAEGRHDMAELRLEAEINLFGAWSG